MGWAGGKGDPVTGDGRREGYGYRSVVTSLRPAFIPLRQTPVERSPHAGPGFGEEWTPV